MSAPTLRTPNTRIKLQIGTATQIPLILENGATDFRVVNRRPDVINFDKATKTITAKQTATTGTAYPYAWLEITPTKDNQNGPRVDIAVETFRTLPPQPSLTTPHTQIQIQAGTQRQITITLENGATDFRVVNCRPDVINFDKATKTITAHQTITQNTAYPYAWLEITPTKDNHNGPRVDIGVEVIPAQAQPRDPQALAPNPQQQEATNIAIRQATLDRIKARAPESNDAQDLAYLIKSFFDLNTDRLQRVAETKRALVAKLKTLQPTLTHARDIYLITKYAQTLGENPPTKPTLEFNHTEILKNARATLLIHPSHSDTHASNLTYELQLSNLSAEITQGLRDGAVILTAPNVDTDTTATIKAQAISPTGSTSEWSDTISVAIKTSVYAGFIENITTNKSRRINTGTAEDNLWLDKVVPRINERANDDPVTQFFNRPDMPHSHIQRYALRNDGSLTKLPDNATLESPELQPYLNSPEYQCVSRIIDHYVIDVEFTYNNQDFMLKLVGLSPFSFDLNKYGYQGYTNLQGRGTDRSGIISSVFVEGFYIGSWESVAHNGKTGSFFLTSNPKPANSRTRAQFREQTQSFNPHLKIQNHYHREALAFLYSIERGYLGSTADMKTTDQSKWAIYAWNTTGANDESRLYEAISFASNNATLNLPVSESDKRARMHIYRGICNIAGNIWEFLDGIYLQDKRLYLAHPADTYTDDTHSNTYHDTQKVLQITNGAHVSRVYPGTMIPRETISATDTTGTTDKAWIKDGQALVTIGGSAWDRSGSGVYAWAGNQYFNLSHWAWGARVCFDTYSASEGG